LGDIQPQKAYAGVAEETGMAPAPIDRQNWRHAPNRAFAQPVHDRTGAGQTPALIGLACRWSPVLDSSSVPVANNKWLSAVAATGGMCIVHQAVPMRRALPHCAGPPGNMVPPAGAGSPMLSANAVTEHASNKK